MRLSFVGELGWELHAPRPSCLPVYQALMTAGAKHGLVNASYRAIDSLSIEKGVCGAWTTGRLLSHTRWRLLTSPHVSPCSLPAIPCRPVPPHGLFPQTPFAALVPGPGDGAGISDLSTLGRGAGISQGEGPRARLGFSPEIPRES